MIVAHHRPDPAPPAMDPAYSQNLDGMKAALGDAADEVVHVLGPLVPDVMPFAVAYLLLWWAFDWLIGVVQARQGGQDDADDAMWQVNATLQREDDRRNAARGMYSR